MTVASTSGVKSRNLELIPFPKIPPEIAKVVEESATRITTARQRAAIANSIAVERSLDEFVREDLDAAKKSAQLRDIAHHIESEEGWRTLVSWTRLRASLLWPLSPLLYFHGVEEVSVMGCERIAVSANGSEYWYEPPPGWDSDAIVRAFFEQTMAVDGVRGRQGINTSSPAVEFSFDRFRFAVAIDPVLTGRHTIAASVRVPNWRFSDLDSLVGAGMLSAGAARFVQTVVEQRGNILISGGTKSGKTTVLRTLARHFEDDAHIFVIEDTPELYLEDAWEDWQPFVIATGTVPNPQSEDPLVSMKFLARFALRMAPTRIIVGETRGSESDDMVRALSSGHDGGLATIHADDPGGAITTMADFLMETGKYSVESAERRVRRAIDLVIQVYNDPHTGKKMVTEIVAINRNNEDIPVYTRREGALRLETKITDNLPRRLASRLINVLGGHLPE